MGQCSFRITLFFVLFIATQGMSQGQWVWMHGDIIPDQRSAYMTKGLPNPINKPAARYEALEWTDMQGNFWLYSGTDGFAVSDLWKYDPQINQWAIIHSDTLSFPWEIYGSIGVPGPLNSPGKRDLGAITWTDLSGNLWLFGGCNTRGKNDLWKFDIGLNQWTWMHGSTGQDLPGYYGTKGVASPFNIPRTRCETSCSWADSKGNLWLFGGASYDFTAGIGYMNDLWKYEVASNQWTWMSGDSITNQAGVYGQKGVAAPTNKPGGRHVYASWIDKSDNLWFFGGSGYHASGGPRDMNDLWMYNTTTNEWTWMSGSNVLSGFSNYGTRCVEDIANVPRARMETRARWTDECGNFWMFGGAYATIGIRDALNDLWRYNPITGKWTWVSGDNISNQISVYGTKGLPAITNKPSSRLGAVSWKNKEGLWLFGGYNIRRTATTYVFEPLNDLWKFIPESPVADFTYTPVSGCKPLTTVFADNSDPGCNDMKSYRWDFGDPASGAMNFSDSINPVHTYNTSGTFTVKLLVTNCSGMSDSMTKQIIVHSDPVITAMPDTSICMGDSILVSVVGAGVSGTYSWVPVGGISSSTGSGVMVSPIVTTTFVVTGTDANGCSSADSVTIAVIPVLTIDAGTDQSICAGESIQLSARGGINYSWSPVAGVSSSISANPIASPTSTTTYMLADISGNCSNIDSVTITVNSLPAITFTGSGSGCTPLCVNFANTTLNTQSQLWDFDDGNTSLSNSLQHCFNMPGVYSVSLTVTDTYGCNNTDTATIVVTPVLTINAGLDQSICTGGSIQLSVSGGASYSWSPGVGLTSPTSANPIASPTSTITYTVIGTTGNCFNIDSVTIIVNPLPVITFSGADSGCAPMCVDFTNTTVNTQSQFWDFGDGTTSTSPASQHCYNIPGVYSVSLSVTDNNSCSNSIVKAGVVTVYPNPQAAFNINPQKTSVLNPGIFFTDQSVGATYWMWNFGDVLNSNSLLQHPYFVFQDTGVYEIELMVTNIYGCADTARHRLQITPECAIYIPNTFTPNGDNVNDFFYPSGVGLNWGTFEMWIFDRWGNLIYKTNDINKPWNGHANSGNDLAQIDTYVWIISVKDLEGIKHKSVGNINLVR